MSNKSLTKRQAVRECKKLWKEIEMLGISKTNFIYSRKSSAWKKKEYNYNCPLCEYSGTFLMPHTGYPSTCKTRCPLFLQYGHGCFYLGYSEDNIPSLKWLNYIKDLKE